MMIFKKNVSRTFSCDILKSWFISWHTYKHNDVIVSFCQFDRNLDVSGKRDSQLMNGLHQMGL